MRPTGSGPGGAYRPAYTAKDGTRKKSNLWWISYTVAGRQIRERTGTKLKTEAQALLRKRLQERDARRTPSDTHRVTLGELGVMIQDDYAANQRKSWKRRAALSVKALLDYFGADRPAVEVHDDEVTAFRSDRLAADYAVATVNRDLAALRRMYRLARRRLDGYRPEINTLAEHNTRKGFFEEPQFRAVLRRLPAELQLVIEVAYVTGWRVASEILNRQWRHLDLKAGWLRLEPGETKNDEGRQFPLTDRLRLVLKAQRRATTALERKQGRVIPWIFHRDGERIRHFRRAWLTACREAGVPGRLLHDFRRTAVRNLERAGVPRSAAMAMVGHRTQAIYSRYAIADEGMLKEAAKKLERFQASARRL